MHFYLNRQAEVNFIDECSMNADFLSQHIKVAINKRNGKLSQNNSKKYPISTENSNNFTFFSTNLNPIKQ